MFTTQIQNPNSFINLMKNATNGQLNKDECGVLSDDEIVANATIFIFGGYESTTEVLTRVFYNLCLNQNAQQTLYDEVYAIYCKHQVWETKKRNKKDIAVRINE